MLIINFVSSLVWNSCHILRELKDLPYLTDALEDVLEHIHGHTMFLKIIRNSVKHIENLE